MNDFERRMIDLMQTSSWIASVARKDKKVIAIDYFNYNTIVGPLASGAAGQSLIQIQADSDFALTYMSGVTFVSNSGVQTPFATVQITDTGTGKTFFNTPTAFTLVYGTSGFPFLLPSPRVIAPNVNLKTDITNVNSTAAATYYISYMGARIYYAS